MRKNGSGKLESNSYSAGLPGTYDSYQHYSQFLFDTLRTAVLYLDKWGRIRYANAMSKQLFLDEYLIGKTVLEVLNHWDNPIHSYQEILRVARTGHSVIGLIEKVSIDGSEHWFQTDKIAVENDSHGFNGVVYTLDDITQLKQQEISLVKSEANYKAFVENSGDATWRLDFSVPILLGVPVDELRNSIETYAVMGDCNHLFHRIYDVDPEECFSNLPFGQLHFRHTLINLDEFIRQDFHLVDQRIVYNALNGEERHLKVSTRGVIKDNVLVGIWGVTRDVTERKRYIDRLEYQTTHDILTGLPNRTQLETLVDKAILECPADKKLALMIIDLDSFKEVNDTLGHNAGDSIIKAIGPRISQQLLGIPSVVARLGGDEFAILMPVLARQAQAEIVGRSILDCIRQYFRIGDIDVEVRASLGISIYPDQGRDFSTLLRYADIAMYCAKKDMLGLSVYHSNNDPHSAKRLMLMSELGKAINNNELSLHFQPKISLANNRVEGVEALSRWTHPVMGIISPAEFVPIAEMTGLINDMTAWVLDQSLRQIKQWEQESLHVNVAVNISARNLLQDNFCEHIECLLSKYHLPATCLGLEITESTLMKNTEKTLSVLNQLNDIGIELSIDDFGTGYSSLAYLKRLPVKWLKIDYSFIVNMMQNEQDQIIVNSTINLAHNLGLSVVAEGVESADIMRYLGDMACEHAQGFHIARPMPADEFTRWLCEYLIK